MKFKSSLMIGSLALSLTSFGSGGSSKITRTVSAAEAARKALRGEDPSTNGFLEKMPESQRKFFVPADQNFEFPFEKDENGDVIEGDTFKKPGFITLKAGVGEVALITRKGEPLFRKGRRYINLPRGKGFDDEKEEGNLGEKVVAVHEALIQHGTWTIVRVGAGQLGYMENLDSGDPMFLLPGSHKFNSPVLRFKKFLSLRNDINRDDKWTLLQVNSGQQALVDTVGGKFKSLNPGLHLIREPDSLKEVISTQKEMYPLGGRNHGPYVTRNHVQIYLPATVRCQIKDPHTAFGTAFNDMKDYENQLIQQATAVLSRTIQGNDLEDFEAFVVETQNEFLKRFREEFGEISGIEIHSLTLGSYTFAEAAMQKQMEEQNKENARLANERARVENEKKLELAKAEASRAKQMFDAATALKVAEAQAAEMKISRLAELDLELQRVKALSETEFGRAYLLAEMQFKLLASANMVVVPSDSLKESKLVSGLVKKQVNHTSAAAE